MPTPASTEIITLAARFSRFISHSWFLPPCPACGHPDSPPTPCSLRPGHLTAHNEKGRLSHGGVGLSMADHGLKEFTVWREIGQSPSGPVLEAAPVSEPGARVTVWPGTPPAIAAAVHPLVAVPLGVGEMDGNPVWVEDRPSGPLMSDLDAPLEVIDATGLMAQIADGLGALHARGHAHGQVVPGRVVVTLDGTPVLLGAGVHEGTQQNDLEAAVAMLKRLCPDAPVPGHSSAAELAAGLRETALSTEATSGHMRELVEMAMLPPPASPRTLSIRISPMGFTDEVQPDLGPDERVRGLLDQWSNTGSNDELTEDRTETISATELAAQGRAVMLERLGDLYRRPALRERFANQEGTPCGPLKALIADEPLDPLPVADGVLRRRAPFHEQENTVEVTQEAPTAGLPLGSDATGEITGWTGGETTVPRSSNVRLLTIALVAALGTLAALAALTAYLTYVNP